MCGGQTGRNREAGKFSCQIFGHMSNKIGAVSSTPSVSSLVSRPQMSHSLMATCSLSCLRTPSSAQLFRKHPLLIPSLAHYFSSHSYPREGACHSISRCCEWRRGLVDCVVVLGMGYCMSPIGSSELPGLQMTAFFGEAVDFKKWDLGGGNGSKEKIPWVLLSDIYSQQGEN